MERLLGWKFWAFTITGYIFFALTVGQVLYNWLKSGIGSAGFPTFETVAPMLVGAIFFILYFKPVWRWIWRWRLIGPWLSRAVFPDLNGDWDVEMYSNRSRIEKMFDAAKNDDRPRYDAEKDFERIPLKAVSTFEKAVIDQGWAGVTMTLHPKTNGADNSVKAEESITIAFDLLRDGARRPQIAYVFAQKNKATNLASTDVPDFLGAALLGVNEDATQLKGTFFTARNWARGFNTAGEIKLTRRPAARAEDARAQA